MIIAIPGIGRKTAERLLIELRDKVESITVSGGNISAPQFSVRNDAVTALANLGYNRGNAEKYVKIIMDKTPAVTIEELIKEALSMLNK